MSALADDTAVRLTPRQAEFLALFAAGKTRNEIGAACYVSPYTVRDILAQAQERLGGENMRQTIVKALAVGILVGRRDGSVEVATLVAEHS
jgi:DNA-binding CsgD family transcriptional regulator